MTLSGKCTGVVVFDLDDTLYLERNYAKSGFRSVAAWAKENLGIEGLFDAAWTQFLQGDRSKIFDAVLQSFGLDPDPAIVKAMVSAYRTHFPDIALEPDVLDWLGQVPPGLGLAIITDGFRDAQERKIAALALPSLGFDPIIVTDIWGRECWKPHARAYLSIQDHFGLAPQGYAYVADNPLKDFVTPNALGWHTVQILRPERVHQTKPPDAGYAADRKIAVFSELPAALGQIGDFSGKFNK
jgi:putative hydrolase of the HAD superfamily